MAVKQKKTEIDILKVDHQSMVFYVLGTMPLIFNSMSEKAKHELLLPGQRKNKADRAQTLKHDPIREFYDSTYSDTTGESPTLLQLPASCFKGALKGAALDMPGSSKSEIGRLTWVRGERIPIYGIPKLFMSVVRSSGINRTPDVRTRCIVPEWCAVVTISFVSPILRAQSVANLFAAAGIMQGVGDWRTEKGSGTYGQFELVSDTDPLVSHLMSNCGRKPQEAAMEAAEPYDDETGKLLSWFQAETRRRGFKDVKEVA